MIFELREKCISWFQVDFLFTWRSSLRNSHVVESLLAIIEGNGDEGIPVHIGWSY